MEVFVFIGLLYLVYDAFFEREYEEFI